MKTKILALFTVLALSFSVSAQNLNVSGLSETQQAEISLQIAKAKEISKTQPLTNGEAVQKLDGWVDLGTKIGKGLSGAAKEAGIAVNEFSKTPIGLLTTVIIVWSFIGNMVYHFVGAVIMLSIGVPLINHIFRKISTTYEFDSEGKMTEKTESLGDNEALFFWISHVVLFVASSIVMFSYK